MTQLQLPGVRVGQEQGSGSELRDPPRRVPVGLTLGLWFGGPIGWIAWLFALIGAVVCAMLLPLAEIDPRGYGRSAPAEITDVERTLSTEDDQHIFAVRYRFTTDDGVAHTGTSYTTDTELPAQAQVEYDSDNPARSRIEGMRANRFGPVVLFVLVFPIIGLVLAGARLVRGRLERQLLQHGVAARARLIRKTATNVTINRVRVMRLEYEFTTATGELHRFSVKTHEHGRHDDDATEAMVYDPNKPSRATTLRHLPGRPQIVDGEWVARSGARYAILPALTAMALATMIGLFIF